MTDEGSRLFVDSDWKEEAAREKARLAEQEAKEQSTASGQEALDSSAALFLELVNMMAMQAMIGLGGYRGPGGEVIPPNTEAARLHIDMLGVLEEKTKGNLSEEEAMVIGRVLHELRMQYVQVAGVSPGGVSAGGGSAGAPGSEPGGDAKPSAPDKPDTQGQG